MSCSRAASRNSSSYGRSSSCQFEHLKEMIENVSFRMIFRRLLYLFERLQHEPEHLVRIDLLLHLGDGVLQVHVGVLGGNQVPRVP